MVAAAATKGVMRLLLLLAASAAAWTFRLTASAAAAVADGQSGCVFRSWAGGSCGCCSFRGEWWLRLRFGPLQLLLLLAASAA